jgi:hypothetical protein
VGWDVGTADYFAYLLSNELEFHADHESAVRAARWSLAYFRGRADTLTPHWLVLMAVRAGDLEEAHRLLASLKAGTPHSAVWVGTAGIVALASGDTVTAARMDDSLAHGSWPHQWGREVFERARLAAARGDRAGAVAFLRQLQRNGPALSWLHDWWPGLAPLRGYPPFEELLRARE